MEQFYRQITSQIPQMVIKQNEPLKNHTSFRIGGAARLMAFPKDAAQLSSLLQIVTESKLPFRILGSGTNVLAPDEGIEELVICTKDALEGLHISGTTVTAMAGQSLAKAACFARDHALSGMECLHGIPGSVGGGVYMNAGAYDCDVAAVCQSVRFLHFDGKITEHSGALFGYRSSVFQSMPGIILSASFSLTPAKQEQIRLKMQTLAERRRASQPLEYPSAGSAFKRPEGYYAGSLIEQSGMKGFRVGDAAVSEKHAGFIINLANATAADVKNLIAEVQNAVYRHFSVLLEPEIRIW